MPSSLRSRTLQPQCEWRKPLHLWANGLHRNCRKLRVAKAPRYGTQQVPQGIDNLALSASKNGSHLEVRLISRYVNPEGLGTRKGFITLHLRHPHADPYQTVGASCRSIWLLPHGDGGLVVQEPRRQAKPYGIHDPGSIASTRLPTRIALLFDYITYPQHPLRNILSPQSSKTFLPYCNRLLLSLIASECQIPFYNGMADLEPSI